MLSGVCKEEFQERGERGNTGGGSRLGPIDQGGGKVAGLVPWSES